MKRALPLYAVCAYAFLHVPLVILAVFSVNSSRFTAWEGFSLRWYGEMLSNRELLESAGNSLVIAVASTALWLIVRRKYCWRGMRSRSLPVAYQPSTKVAAVRSGSCQ